MSSQELHRFARLTEGLYRPLPYFSDPKNKTLFDLSPSFSRREAIKPFLSLKRLKSFAPYL